MKARKFLENGERRVPVARPSGAVRTPKRERGPAGGA